MKTGINAWSIKTDADFEEAFSHAKAAGFDGIELNVDANNAGHSLTFGTTDAELDEIMAISEKHSLQSRAYQPPSGQEKWGREPRNQ